MPKEGAQCICWSMALIDSFFKMGSCYFQVFLEGCKYIVKEKEVTKYINIFLLIQIKLMKNNVPLINAQNVCIL